MITERETVQIRRARLQDVPTVIALHYRTFDVQTNQLLLLGRRFMARAFRWYCGAPEAFSLVAEHAGAVVGYITVSQRSYYAVFTANWSHVLLAFACRPALLADERVRRRLVSLMRRGWLACWGAGPRRSSPAGRGGGLHRACLAYLAIDPGVRLAGAAAALVRAALNECQARGWHDVVTSFRTNNIRARYLFACLGFKESPEQSTDDLTMVRWDASAAPQRFEGGAS